MSIGKRTIGKREIKVVDTVASSCPGVVLDEPLFLILNKPAGWITNQAVTVGKSPVVQNWIAEKFDFEIAKDKNLRSGIVHRLDKETSGLLLVAKTKDSFYNLQSQFRERLVKKKYLALVHGDLDLDNGEVKAPVGRLPWNRERFGVVPGGREAVTFYHRVDKFFHPETKETLSLIEASPQTGRTHQIRVHFKYLGFPLVSDPLYAGRKTLRRDRKWCPRLFLHAFYLEFNQPHSDERIKAEVDLPPDLKEAIRFLDREK